MTAAVAPTLAIVQPGQKLAALADVPGDFAEWMLAGMDWPHSSVVRIHPHQSDALPAPDGIDAVIITGSAAMVTDAEDWMRRTEDWIRALCRLGRPVLGVCFGHQLLAHALGGEVADNPNGVEVGTVETRLLPAASSDPLLAGLPRQCPVQASHRQAVTRLPPGAVRLAASARDPNHAFRYGGATWGVQFHPEFDDRVVRAYIDWYGGVLESQGDDPGAMRAAVTETPAATGVLSAFAAFVAGTPPGIAD